MTSGRSDITSGPESPSPTGPLSPGVVVMKSPILDNLDSPQLSDNSEDEDDEDRSKIESQPGKATGAVVDEVTPSALHEEHVNEAEEDMKGGQPHTEGEG